LRECPARGDQGERRDENKRRIAEHRGLSRGAPMQRSCGARVPLLPGRLLRAAGFFCRPSRSGVGGGERIRPNCGAITF
jgi:hypothetical protein